MPGSMNPLLGAPFLLLLLSSSSFFLFYALIMITFDRFDRLIDLID